MLRNSLDPDTDSWSFRSGPGFAGSDSIEYGSETLCSTSPLFSRNTNTLVRDKILVDTRTCNKREKGKEEKKKEKLKLVLFPGIYACLLLSWNETNFEPNVEKFTSTVQTKYSIAGPSGRAWYGSHTRKIKTEEKAEAIPFFAALAIWHQDDLKNRMNCTRTI